MNATTDLERGFSSAVDRAWQAGSAIPCRLDARFDSERLKLSLARELAALCRTECPVFTECRALADVRPRWEKEGSVVAGEFYRQRSGQPYWQLLSEDLRARIDVGEYKSGDSLPDVETLGANCGTRLSTVRAALLHLDREGLIRFDRLAGKAVVANSAGEEHSSVA
ncbi:GntR family transcriptional regulator [Kribbella sp. NPDC004536]|uniref:GntR family transcriptional regulator n=1 Tax=Kribbella sp. NPDC004536 TaxID=3364106 RepID=UPI0036AC5C2C